MNNEKGVSRNSTGLEIGKSKILVPAVRSTSLVTLANPLSALSFPIWKRGRFGGEKGGCSISLTTDENGGLLWCRIRAPSLKKKNKNNHLIPSALLLSKRDQTMQTRALLLPLQQLQNDRNSDS